MVYEPNELTWKQFLEEATKAGIKDDDIIGYIDIHGDSGVKFDLYNIGNDPRRGICAE